MKLHGWLAVALLVGATAPGRLYEQGRFAEALERYRALAAKQETNWPLHHNLGAAAYRAGEFDEAARAFERALGAEDPALQARALYNLGNTQFRLGEQLEPQGRDQALPVYRRSLQSFEEALKLAPADPDAEWNRDLVRQKIEELETEEQPPEQPPQQPEPGDEPPPDNGQQPAPGEEQPEPAEANAGEPQPQPQPGAAQESAAEPAPQRAQPDYQQIQAQGLLDRLREDERMWDYYPELRKHLNDAAGPAKDW